MTRLPKWPWFALASALASALANAAGAAPRFPEALEQRWTDAMRLAHVPGLAVVLVRDTGVVAMSTLGQRDVDRALPVTPDTRFYLASCTKPFVATVVWTLAWEGRLGIDDPVSRRLPGFRLADAGATDSLTLRDLLSHRWGLNQPAIGLGTAYTGQMTDERFGRLLATVRPERRFRYSNLHYQIAGRLIAAQTGRSWQQNVVERIFVPAGMTRAATMAKQLYDDPDAASPYVWRDGRLEGATRKTDRTLHAAGGLGASIGDAARWLRLQLGDGVLDGRRVLPASVVREMRVPAVEVPDRHPLRTDQRRIACSAGWELRAIEGDTVVMHTGGFGGAASYLGTLPARGIGVAVLANNHVPVVTEWIAAEAIDFALGRPSPDVSARFAELVARMGAPPDADTLRGQPTQPCAAYVGRYTNPDWGEVEVTQKDGRVVARMGDLPLPLAWDEENRFVADGDTPGRFEFDDRGRARAMVMQMSAPDSARFVRR